MAGHGALPRDGGRPARGRAAHRPLRPAAALPRGGGAHRGGRRGRDPGPLARRPGPRPGAHRSRDVRRLSGRDEPHPPRGGAHRAGEPADHPDRPRRLHPDRRGRRADPGRPAHRGRRVARDLPGQRPARAGLPGPRGVAAAAGAARRAGGPRRARRADRPRRHRRVHGDPGGAAAVPRPPRAAARRPPGGRGRRGRGPGVVGAARGVAVPRPARARRQRPAARDLRALAAHGRLVVLVALRLHAVARGGPGPAPLGGRADPAAGVRRRDRGVDADRPQPRDPREAPRGRGDAGRRRRRAADPGTVERAVGPRRDHGGGRGAAGPEQPREPERPLPPGHPGPDRLVRRAAADLLLPGRHRGVDGGRDRPQPARRHLRPARPGLVHARRGRALRRRDRRRPLPRAGVGGRSS